MAKVTLGLAPIKKFVEVFADGEKSFSALREDVEAPLSDSDREELKIVKAYGGVTPSQGKTLEQLQDHFEQLDNSQISVPLEPKTH